MTVYWPMAKIRVEKDSVMYPDGTRIQSTYDSALTIQECIDTINTWKEHYNYDIIEAWIQVVENDIHIGNIMVGYAPLYYKPIGEED